MRIDVSLIFCALLTFHMSVANAGKPKFDASAKHLVGTYSTVDGTTRFTLDRFSQPPRIRYTNSKVTTQVTLLKKSVRNDGWNAYNPEGKWLFFMDAEGNLSGYSAPIKRVADAKPLKKLTITGTYVVPLSPFEVAEAKYKALSVQEHMKGIRSQDAGDFAVLEKAFAASTP